MDLNNKFNRLILINQFKIIRNTETKKEPCLYRPEFCDKAIKILSNGYVHEYDELVDFIDEQLPIQECNQVWDILEVYRRLQDSFFKLNDKKHLTESKVKFPFFDRHYECRLANYCEFLREDDGRYINLKIEPHSCAGPMRERYAKQIAKEKEVFERTNRDNWYKDEMYSVDEIEEILQAKDQ